MKVTCDNMVKTFACGNVRLTGRVAETRTTIATKRAQTQIRCTIATQKIVAMLDARSPRASVSPMSSSAGRHAWGHAYRSSTQEPPFVA